MVANDPFAGRPVIHFDKTGDRRNFLKWAGTVGVGSTLALVVRDRFATAQDQEADIGILNYALTLEYLGADFYTQGLEENLLSGRELELVEPILQHETVHVAAIISTIENAGGTPIETPAFQYPEPVFNDGEAFLQAALELERLSVKAYHGQITNFTDPKNFRAAASIAGSESRHAAVLADLTGADPFPAPLEKPLPRERVMQALQPFVEA